MGIKVAMLTGDTKDVAEDVGKKLDRNLSKALVTLLFAALEGSYMVTSSDKEETTKLTVIKL